MLKVGDTIEIKPFSEIEKMSYKRRKSFGEFAYDFTFSNCVFLENMIPYCETEATIKWIGGNSPEKAIILEGVPYYWREWMFKNIVDDNKNYLLGL